MTFFLDGVPFSFKSNNRFSMIKSSICMHIQSLQIASCGQYFSKLCRLLPLTPQTPNR